jgi:hypothetical protein
VQECGCGCESVVVGVEGMMRSQVENDDRRVVGEGAGGRARV